MFISLLVVWVQFLCSIVHYANPLESHSRLAKKVVQDWISTMDILSSNVSIPYSIPLINA